MLLVYWALGLWFDSKASLLYQQSISQELASIREHYQSSVKRQLLLSHIYAGPLKALPAEAQASLDSAWHERTHALGLHFYRVAEDGLTVLGQSTDAGLPVDVLNALESPLDEVSGAVLLDSGPHILTMVHLGAVRVLVSRVLSENELNRLGQSGFVKQVRIVAVGGQQPAGHLIPIDHLGAAPLALEVVFNAASYKGIAVTADRMVWSIFALGVLLLALGYFWFRRSLVSPLRSMMVQLGKIDPNASEYQPLSAEGCTEVRHFSRVSNQLLAEIFAQKERGRAILEGIADAVLLTDTQGKLIYLNPPATRLFGRGIEQLKGRSLAAELGLKESTIPDFLVGSGQQRWQGRLRLVDKLLQYSLSRIEDHQGHMQGALMALRDVTAEERLKAQLRRQAEEDSITGLPNRASFESRLQAISGDVSSAAVCYLDLEQFKIINDSCGHLQGDEMLRMVATALRGCLREQDLLARLGGDEFGILLLDISAQQVAKLLKKLQRQLSMQVLEYQGQCYRVGVSIGVAFARAPVPPLGELFKDADIACIAAKRKGCNQIHFYDDKDKELNYQRNAPKWAMRIAHAIHSNELELYYQPIHALDGANHRQRMEVLLRIREADGRILPPAQFIASAERFKLMPEVDKAVVSRAMRWLAARPELWSDHCLSINLSGNSLGVEGMETFIVEELRRTGAPSSCICFEITETSAIQNRQRALDMLRSLRKKGFSFAIDDFGSGFASYGYLRELPVDYVKIDGCFVRQLAGNAKDYAIVKSIHDVCAVMGIETVAEFVESQEIIRKLEEIGINYAQGYAVGRPKPLDDYLGRPQLARLA
ncbi:putative bifunctional diguanylate cyclase/phosphodiesterase [Shewanella sp.]|uniref:putative bifunctional diguanylate cyclase/phosphodiesterase n=1 Tax=Shewanella sp. TaxID=50422 RepID=UPI0035695AAC